MSTFWTNKRNDLEGSRWGVWEKHFRNIITWDDFKDRVLAFNPHINLQSRWMFIKGWEYIVPSNTEIKPVSRVDTEPDFDKPTERNKLAQELLKKDGHYTGNIDGIMGNKSLNALANYDIDVNWPPERKTIAFLQIKAKENSIDPGKIDGYWGPVTEHAVGNLYLLITQGKIEENWRPEDHPVIKPQKVWPVQYTKAFDEFFGKKGEANLVNLNLPYKHYLSWDTATGISRLKCHKKVHDSLQKVLTNVLDHYGAEEIKRLRLDIWGGCYSNRAVRGGSKASMHSWGIAMDYDPANNKLKWGRDRANFAKPEYEAWWKCWEEEGWVSLGRQRNFDWMHVQAANLR